MPIFLTDINQLKDEMEIQGPDQEWIVERVQLTEGEFLDMQEHPGF